MTPALPHFLLVGAVLFGFGVYTAVTRTNAVGVLMGIELMLNGANVNFVAFHRYASTPLLEGQIFTLLVIVVAAAEAAVALGIILAVYANQRSIDVSEADTLRD